MGAIPKLDLNFKHFTPNVYDEEFPGSSLYLCVADMVATTYRMKRGLDVALSPQCLMDSPFEFPARVKYLMDPGLFRLDHYPLIGKPRDTMSVNTLLGYEVSYPLDEVVSILAPEHASRAIIYNFTDEGWRVPLAGSLYADYRFFELKTERYRPDDKAIRKYGNGVAPKSSNWVLIVGINTLGKEKDHYCLVKNVAGPDVGMNGFSKVALDAFANLIVPILDHEGDPCAGFQRFLSTPSVPE